MFKAGFACDFRKRRKYLAVIDRLQRVKDLGFRQVVAHRYGKSLKLRQRSTSLGDLLQQYDRLYRAQVGILGFIAFDGGFKQLIECRIAVGVCSKHVGKVEESHLVGIVWFLSYQSLNFAIELCLNLEVGQIESGSHVHEVCNLVDRQLVRAHAGNNRR